MRTIVPNQNADCLFLGLALLCADVTAYYPYQPPRVTPLASRAISGLPGTNHVFVIPPIRVPRPATCAHLPPPPGRIQTPSVEPLTADEMLAPSRADGFWRSRRVVPVEEPNTWWSSVPTWCGSVAGSTSLGFIIITTTAQLFGSAAGWRSSIGTAWIAVVGGAWCSEQCPTLYICLGILRVAVPLTSACLRLLLPIFALLWGMVFRRSFVPPLSVALAVAQASSTQINLNIWTLVTACGRRFGLASRVARGLGTCVSTICVWWWGVEGPTALLFVGWLPMFVPFWSALRVCFAALVMGLAFALELERLRETGGGDSMLEVWCNASTRPLMVAELAALVTYAWFVDWRGFLLMGLLSLAVGTGLTKDGIFTLVRPYGRRIHRALRGIESIPAPFWEEYLLHEAVAELIRLPLAKAIASCLVSFHSASLDTFRRCFLKWWCLGGLTGVLVALWVACSIPGVIAIRVATLLLVGIGFRGCREAWGSYGLGLLSWCLIEMAFCDHVLGLPVGFCVWRLRAIIKVALTTIALGVGGFIHYWVVPTFFVKRLWLYLSVSQRRAAHRRRYELEISRQDAFDTTLQHLHQLSVADLQRPFTVKFTDEEGLDQSGLTKEWMTLVTTHLIRPNNKFFEQEEEDGSVTISSESNFIVEGTEALTAILATADVFGLYEVVGKFLAKTVYERQPAGLNLCTGILRYLVDTNVAVTFEDLKDYKPQFAAGLERFGPGTPGVDLTWTTEVTEGGHTQEVALCGGGESLPVTLEDYPLYLDRLSMYLFRDKIAHQLSGLRSGFFCGILPESLIRRLTVAELRQLVAGRVDLSLEDWREHTLYVNTRDGDDGGIVSWLWLVMSSLNSEERGLMFRLATSLSKPPHGGFADLRPPFTVWIMDNLGDDKLPSFHTCVNTLQLPRYTSLVHLQKKFHIMLQTLSPDDGFSVA